MLSALALLALTQVPFLDEGQRIGLAYNVDCRGPAIRCALRGTTVYVVIDAGMPVAVPVACSGDARLTSNGSALVCSTLPTVTIPPMPAFSGIGACAAGTFVSALNDGGSPTCATPAGGSAVTGACSGTDKVVGIDGGVLLCAADVDTNTTVASDVACAGACVADTEISAVGGGKVSGAVATATALAADGANCSGANFPKGVDSAGAAQGCVTVAYSDLSGSVPTWNQSTSGLAATATALAVDPVACSANQWVNDTAANGSHVCAQPGFSNLSGTAASAQLPAATSATKGTVLVPTATCNATTQWVQWDGSTFSCQTSPKVVTANVTNSTVTPANISGLSWPLLAATEYGFDCVIVHQGTATSAPRFNLNGPGSPTNVTVKWERATSATANTISTDTAFSAAAQTAAITSAAVTTVMVSRVFGHITNGANAGNAQLMLTSSTAGQMVTVFRGSRCTVY